MYKKILALMCLTFSIVLFCMAVSATEAETVDISAIYVSENATEGGTGAIDAPVATLAEAYNLLGNYGTIYLMDTVSVSSTSDDCFIAPTHAGKITITSADGYNGALDLTGIEHFHFGGETEWNGIGIIANDVVLSADNYTVTMGEGLEMSSTSEEIYRGGHTYCGAKIYLAAYAPCETANVSRTTAGGRLNVYSGEYWSVSAWYGETVTITDGETQIFLGDHNATDSVWIRYLCPGMYSSAQDNTLTSTNSKVTVIVNDGVNTLEAYRFTKNSFSGSMTVNWLLQNSPQGNAIAFLATDFSPAGDAECTLNVYADQSNASAKGSVLLLMRGAFSKYIGNSDASLEEYCANGSHSIIARKEGYLYCILCGYKECAHRTVGKRLIKVALCTQGDLYQVYCTDFCKQDLRVEDQMNFNMDNHSGQTIEYLYNPDEDTIEHSCGGCGKVFRTDYAGNGEMDFLVKVGAKNMGYSASQPVPASGNLYFNDFSKAMEYIALAANLYGEAVLNVDGSAEVPAGYSTPESEGHIKIVGGRMWFREPPRRFYMNADVTFEDITFRTNSATAGVVICAQNNKLVMGEGIVMGNVNTIPTEDSFPDCNCVKMYVVGGFEGRNDNVMNTDITIRSGDYWYVGGWNYNASTNDGVGKITIGKTNPDDKLQVFYLCPYSVGDGYITRQAESTVIVDGDLHVKRFYVTTMNKATTGIRYTTNVVLKGDITGLNKDMPSLQYDVYGCPSPFPYTVINVYTDTRVATAVDDSDVFCITEGDISLRRLGATVNEYDYTQYCTEHLGGHIDSDTDTLCDECGYNMN